MAQSVPPQLAVVIPVFNDAAGLRASLNSLRAVILPCATVTIVVDDGSETAIEAGDGDEAIGLRIVRHSANRGIEHALNTGCDAARILGAQFIARLDAGDTMARDRLTRQLQLLMADPDLGLVGSSARFVDAAGQTQFIFAAPQTDAEIRRRMHVSSVILHPTAMFRAALLDRVGGYSAAFPAAEDYDLFFRMLRHCKAACIPDALVTTVVSDGGISVRRRRAQLRSRLRIQLQNFDPWCLHSYFGVCLTLLLLAVPQGMVMALKRLAGASRF